MFALKNIISPLSPRSQGVCRPFLHTYTMVSRIITTIPISHFKSYYTTITDKDDWNTITNCLRTNCIPTFENFLAEVENKGDTNRAKKITDLIRYSKIIQTTVIRALTDIESAKSSRMIQRDFIEGASSWYLSVEEVKSDAPSESVPIHVTESMENISVCIDKFNQVVFDFTNSYLPK